MYVCIREWDDYEKILYAVFRAAEIDLLQMDGVWN